MVVAKATRQEPAMLRPGSLIHQALVSSGHAADVAPGKPVTPDGVRPDGVRFQLCAALLREGR